MRLAQICFSVVGSVKRHILRSRGGGSHEHRSTIREQLTSWRGVMEGGGSMRPKSKLYTSYLTVAQAAALNRLS